MIVLNTESESMSDFYYTYKQYLVKRYGEKVYKLPIQIPVSCPNKDPLSDNSGCAFCSSKGTGFEALENAPSIYDQLIYAKDKITARYHAEKFIGYFQNYTNTNLPVEKLISYFDEVVKFGVVGIDIATRPDCIDMNYLETLKNYSDQNNVDLTFEIGLQIANDQILSDMNRGHTVENFVQGVKLIKSFGFPVCVHIILNLPKSTSIDVERTINLLNELRIDIVKFHSLYIPNDCSLSRPYIEGKVIICTYEEYVNRVIASIRKLNPSIAISRLVSRIPEENALFSNWNMSWWKIYNDIMCFLKENNVYQGMDYSK